MRDMPVDWVHKSYEPQMRALGATETAESLMGALGPLMLSYKSDIAVSAAPSFLEPLPEFIFAGLLFHPQKVMGEWTDRLIEQDKQAEPDQALP